MSLDASTAHRLTHRLQVAQRDRRLPSTAACLLQSGSVVWSGAAGQVDGRVPTDDTQYRIGSVTKTFVAVAVLRLRDEGVLDLQDHVVAHLSSAWTPASAPLGRVTITQLLMHTAGLPAETLGPWWERSAGMDAGALATQLAGRPAASPPGRRFHYSNVGYAVLGGVLAHHRRRPWHQVISEEILQPLGMRRTTPHPQAPSAPGLAVHPWADVVLPEPAHDAGAMAPAGQLWSTMADLARWLRFLEGDTGEVLSPDTLEEMCAPGAVDDRPGLPWTTAHGLGFQVFNDKGRQTIGHGGSMPGFLAGVQVDRQARTGVAVATNTTAGLDPALAGDLLDLLETHSPAAPTPWQPEPPPGEALELVGTWYWGPTPYLIRAADERLALSPMALPGRASTFRRVDADRWIGLQGYYAGEPLQVVRAVDRSVRHLDVASFVLTPMPYDATADIPGGVDPGGWR